MEIAYKRNEMVGITEFSRSINGFIDKVKNQTVDKLAIMKNNKPAAVIIPAEEYEQMKEICNMVEYFTIADIVDKRMPNGKIGKTISLDEYHSKRMARRENDS